MKCRYFCRLPLDISPVYLTRGISERIGLKNIYQRAQLLYGPESNLEVLSTPGEGTEIIFIFPVKVSQN